MQMKDIDVRGIFNLYTDFPNIFWEVRWHINFMHGVNFKKLPS